MTGLLVSVRNAAEARLALAGGADLIDVKEPHRGSLGPADPTTWREVVDAVAGRRPVSVALGELLTDRVGELAPQAIGIRFAKTGLAGCAAVADWPSVWRKSLAGLQRDVTKVAVAYADFKQARAPNPGEVLQHALDLHCEVILFDTFTKDRGGLLNHLPYSELQTWVREIRLRGLKVVLAGSLDRSSITRVLSVAPDFIAVRGAVSRGDRTGSLDQKLVANLAGILHGTAAA
jgi:hypothetical protein